MKPESKTTPNAKPAAESYDEKFDRMKKKKEERESKTTLSRRDEMALRIACAMIGSNFLIQDMEKPDTPTMGIKTQSVYAVEIADAMIVKLDEAHDA